jgi:hypothetical protein
MWSPAGSTLAFSTAGIERMRIRGNGRVGVNVDPAAQFQVRGPASDTMAEIAVIQSINVAGTDTHGLQISADAVGNIVQLASTGNNTGGFTFLTGSAERMRIDSAGNVGIGTTSPGYLLQVGSRISLSSDGVIQWGQALTGTNRGLLSWDTNIASVNAAANLVLASNGTTERMRITSTGDVGIGTSSPGARFEVAGNTNANFVASIFRNTNAGASAATSVWLGNDVSAAASYIRVNANANSSEPNSLRIANAISGSSSAIILATNSDVERMRINSSGNVGIGTASPSWRVTAYGAAAADVAAQDATGAMVMTVASGTGYLTTNTSNPIIIRTNSVERMRIDSAGNLGLGVAPTASSNYAVFDIKGRATGQSALLNFFDGAGTQTGSLQSDANYGFLAGASGARPFAVFTNGSERMRVKSTGQVRFVPLATAPGSPEAGDVYYDSTTNKLRCYNGTIWNDLF